MEINYKKLGQRIRTIRENNKLTQETLAEMTDLSNNYISNIERNESIPSLQTLVKICSVLRVTPDYVLLDSIYTAKEYLKDDIAKKLMKCSDKNVRLVEKFISLLLEEQE